MANADVAPEALTEEIYTKANRLCVSALGRRFAASTKRKVWFHNNYTFRLTETAHAFDDIWTLYRYSTTEGGLTFGAARHQPTGLHLYNSRSASIFYDRSTPQCAEQRAFLAWMELCSLAGSDLVLMDGQGGRDTLRSTLRGSNENVRLDQATRTLSHWQAEALSRRAAFGGLPLTERGSVYRVVEQNSVIAA